MDSEEENQFVDQLDLDSEDEDGGGVVYKPRVAPPSRPTRVGKKVLHKVAAKTLKKVDADDEDSATDSDEEEDRFFNGEFSDEDEDEGDNESGEADDDSEDDDTGAGVGPRQRKGAAPKKAASQLKAQKKSSEPKKTKTERKPSLTKEGGASSGSLVCWSIVGFLILLTLFFRFQMVTYDVDYESFMSNYAVLGLPEGADFKEVKKAHRQLSLKWHPDKNPGCEECKEKYIKIIAAYETISEFERGKIHLVNKPSKAPTTRGRK